MTVCIFKASTRRQRQGTAGTPWPSRLEELMSSGSSERPYLKNYSRVNEEDTRHKLLFSMCMCKHKYTHIHSRVDAHKKEGELPNQSPV